MLKSRVRYPEHVVRWCARSLGRLVAAVCHSGRSHLTFTGDRSPPAVSAEPQHGLLPLRRRQLIGTPSGAPEAAVARRVRLLTPRGEIGARRRCGAVDRWRRDLSRRLREISPAADSPNTGHLDTEKWSPARLSSARLSSDQLCSAQPDSTQLSSAQLGEI